MATFGLDIGSTSIKAVQLERRGDKFALLAAGITSTPPSGMTSDTEADLAVVATAIKKLITDTKITTKQAVISLPESQVFTRVIQLPYLTDEEIVSAISWQAEPYIPIPVSEAVVDHQVVLRKEPKGPDPGGVEVLLIATPKTLVNRYVKMAQMAGIEIVVVESDLLALTRALSRPDQTMLIADLGTASSDLGIAKNGQLVVARSIPTAGAVLTRAVSTSLNVAVERAEEYKKSYGLSASYLEGQVKNSLDPVFKAIIEEMKKTIQYYKSDLGKDEQVTTAVISGGTAGMQDIIPLLAESLGLEVEIGDPFAQVIKDDKTAQTLFSWAPLYGIAVGLAQNF